MKTCIKCGFPKPEDAFYLRLDTGRLSGECRQCKKEYEKSYRSAHSQKIAVKRRNRGLVARYGITEERYQELFVQQKGCCAICDKPSGEKRLHVDHDHATGRVRGLLCYPCNVGIGYLRDDPRKLRAAAQYLDDGDNVIEVEGFVTMCLRERGKIVPGSWAQGENIWTNTGREFDAMLKSLKAPNTPFREDRIAYIGVGTGAQVEDAGVYALVAPAEYLPGMFLAPLDTPPDFPLTPARTTVRYHRLFDENELTLSPHSSVVISELGLFTNGNQSDYTVGGRELGIATAAKQSPVSYKAIEPVTKKWPLQLEVWWELRH
jgi:hypothetical protein